MENKFVIDDAFSADEYNELTESVGWGTKRMILLKKH